ncbi:hypothetical protein BC829DRAFT_391225 [Chytridium lagenaria]|nr:hypothetical protein BC829DRAFT_391225 [Chytridium lagenaria]
MALDIKDDDIKLDAVGPVELIKASKLDFLGLCGQAEAVSFTKALSSMSLVAKIGEATFSEVFYYTIPILVPLTSLDFSPLTCVTKRLGHHIHESWPLNSRPVAVKVIPFDGDLEINGSGQQKVHEVVQEVQVTRALSGFGSAGCENGQSNFVGFVHVCHGPYPDDLLEAWDDYADDKESENDRPDILHDSQLYAILVLSHGGSSLEQYSLRGWAMARSILLQVFLSLAHAEHELNFEHRDLHWGNILCSTILPEDVGSKRYGIIGGKEIDVDLAGVKVTIIDYTISRCEKGEFVH